MITEEEINKILLSSPMVLPDNPTESGFKAKGIKELFYKYIRVLLGVIDTHLEGLDASTLRQILAHNDEKESHADIRELVRDLVQKDEEICDQLIATITAHNEDEHAHPFYRGWAEMIQRKVDETYNLASGKSKIYPVSDVWEMLDSLSDKLNVGDKFVLATENVPDFILFEKNSTSKGAIPLSQMDLMLGLELEPGKSYLCSNGFLFVATESGIDTSMFAKQAELEGVKTELLDKEKRFACVKGTTQTQELKASTIYSFGLASSISLVAPSNADDDFYSVVRFRSGAEPTAVASQGIIFTQDDTVNGVLIPVKNRLYELHVRKIEGIMVATVSGVDFEVIE